MFPVPSFVKRPSPTSSHFVSLCERVRWGPPAAKPWEREGPAKREGEGTFRPLLSDRGCRQGDKSDPPGPPIRVTPKKIVARQSLTLWHGGCF